MSFKKVRMCHCIKKYISTLHIIIIIFFFAVCLGPLMLGEAFLHCQLVFFFFVTS